MNKKDFPLLIKVSFNKLFDLYRSKLDTGNELFVDRAKKVLKIAEEYPELSDGIDSEEEFTKYGEQVDFILEDFFASVLQQNEIKIATIPFHQTIFRSSERYKNIVALAGEDYDIELLDFPEDQFYIMGCSLVLNQYYGYRVDFRRPFYYKVPDAQGIERSYKVLYNGDFISVEKGPKAIEITPEDVSELLDNFDNVAIWKEKFPPQSWIFKGFVIANMYDATTDVSLSNFKANLIQKEQRDESFKQEFLTIIRAIFNLPELDLGYAIYDKDEDRFMKPVVQYDVHSYILNDKESERCSDSLCSVSRRELIEKGSVYSVSDVKKFHKLYPKNVLYKKLHKQKIGSALIVPLVSEGTILGVLELVSKNTQDLNSINANKLQDLLPYLVDSVKRSVDQKENEIELLIQSECTSIHPSVHWKFKKEAKHVLMNNRPDSPISFKEITFEDVYPLYGQIDIKGSSAARNNATKKDLIEQLKLVQKIISKVFEIESLPIYEQINFRIQRFLNDLDDHLDVDTERNVLSFLKKEIIPLYKHLGDKNPALKAMIKDYNSKVDHARGFVYKHRKGYDDSVTMVNKAMSTLLDAKQKEAQLMYPHYYERFKTDGVEHNMYIGESITNGKSFNKLYLYNLRLWQLQVMCEMENSYYKLKEKLPIPLDVASMILVFNSSLSLRFRMDEKRFDVDGTYNARYEVVKKRVDKANIMGTNERITQPGKIAIIYSQRSDEKEFLKYIAFLQSKKCLGDEVEILELEDLQGVAGLKAIRVNVLYNLEGHEKDFYTYEDLMKEIDA